MWDNDGRIRDLNTLTIPEDEGAGVTLADRDPEHCIDAENGRIPAACYFRDVRARLVETIGSYPVVFGCVAWVTEPWILATLATRRCALIVQKEAYLRSRSPDFRLDLRVAYDKLGGLTPGMFPWPLCKASPTPDERFGVRCLGYSGVGGRFVPRMHHKFLVFGETERIEERGRMITIVAPRAVWTGSFNLTTNAHGSLENAMLIHDDDVARAYTSEFAQLAALTEPLDWTADDVSPQWPGPVQE